MGSFPRVGIRPMARAVSNSSVTHRGIMFLSTWGRNKYIPPKGKNIIYDVLSWYNIYIFKIKIYYVSWFNSKILNVTFPQQITPKADEKCLFAGLFEWSQVIHIWPSSVPRCLRELVGVTHRKRLRRAASQGNPEAETNSEFTPENWLWMSCPSTCMISLWLKWLGNFTLGTNIAPENWCLEFGIRSFSLFGWSIFQGHLLLVLGSVVLEVVPLGCQSLTTMTFWPGSGVKNPKASFATIASWQATRYIAHTRNLKLTVRTLIKTIQNYWTLISTRNKGLLYWMISHPVCPLILLMVRKPGRLW